MASARRLAEVQKRLLIVRRWAYLRYLYMREAFLLTEGVGSVLAVGCGRGYAELALALEFPDVRFHLTDIAPHFQRSMDLVDAWQVPNVSFALLDIMHPSPDRFDFVTSVEVLELIEDDQHAAAMMRQAARKYVFALVPFADKKTNADPALREKHWRAHEHHRVGYDEEDLRHLFPNMIWVQGCYWTDGGALWRREIEALTDPQIIASQAALQQAALRDHRPEVPLRRSQACGIWTLARAGAFAANAPRSQSVATP